MFKNPRLAGALLSCALLMSCGGGSGPAQKSTPPPASYGAVELLQVGSAAQTTWRPGATWPTETAEDFTITQDATVYVDGQRTDLADVQLGSGEAVLLSGVATDADTGTRLLTADHVEIDHVLEGPVEAIDRQHSQVVVLGVTVEIRPATWFNLDGNELQFSASTIDLTQLKPGDTVIVSGNANLAGHVVASRITRGSGGPSLVSAFVSTVDAAQGTFTIGNLTIDYSGAQLSGLESEVPMVGQRVRVRGTQSPGAGKLAASSIEALPAALPGNAGDRVELFGLVNQSSAPSAPWPRHVQVDGHPVTVRLIDTADNCGAPIQDSLVALQGVLGADGSVSADFSCQYVGWGGFGLSGRISAVDAALGTLTVLGYGVQPTLGTQFLSATGQQVAAPDFQVGDLVSVIAGRGAADDTMLAVSVQALAATAGASDVVTVHDANFVLAQPSIVVLGRPITLTAATVFTGLLSSRTPEDFFTQPVPPGDRLCGAEFTFNVIEGTDGSLTATAINEHVDWGNC